MLDLMEFPSEQPKAESVFRSMLHRNGEMSNWGVLRSQQSTSKHMTRIIHRHRRIYDRLTTLLDCLEAECIPAANIDSVKNEIRGYLLALHHIEKECWQAVRKPSDPLYPPTFEMSVNVHFYTTRTPREIMSEYAQDNISYRNYKTTPAVPADTMQSEPNDDGNNAITTMVHDDKARADEIKPKPYSIKSDKDFIRLATYLWDRESDKAGSVEIIDWSHEHAGLPKKDKYARNIMSRTTSE